MWVPVNSIQITKFWNWKQLSLKQTNIGQLQTTLFRSDWNNTVITSGGMNANSIELISYIDADNVSSSSSCSPIYVAHPPLWWYSSLLQRKLWRHKRKRFTNLMNHMKQVFLATHLFHRSLVQLYLLQMCCLFSCVCGPICVSPLQVMSDEQRAARSRLLFVQ